MSAYTYTSTDVREARAADWDRVRLSGIEAAERMKAKGDSQRVTARRLGDVLANENETVAVKLSGSVSECTNGRDNTISGYLAAKRDADVEPQRREVWW